MVNLYIVIGLGNPGKDYTNTRHNIGFSVIDYLSKEYNINLNKIKFKSVFGEGYIGREKVILCKPQTYMNNSGLAVREIVDFYKVDLSNLIVIVDDIDIDFATLRIKRKGSAGSHNGLKSIINHIQRDDFPRIKIGIGSKHPKQDLADFVLSRFSKEELKDMEIAARKAADAVKVMIDDDITEAMNIYNTRAQG